jgi:hypothetical protein
MLLAAGIGSATSILMLAVTGVRIPPSTPTNR